MGVCKAKWIAKLATSTVKAYGTPLVKDDEILKLVEKIDIHDFPGIGMFWSMDYPIRDEVL